jgi:hypothetical protein
LAVALGTHVLGIVLAIVGMSLGASFWAILASNCADTYRHSYNSYDFDPSSRIKRDGYCSCFYDTPYEQTCKSLISGAKLGGGGVTPPKVRIIWIGRANHLDWQGESSGLAGQSKILNDRM